ncbi:excinuclease ABC subunit UvrB [bacterium]|nr:excinuclease ABC subunit UvrB [bacterium]
MVQRLQQGRFEVISDFKLQGDQLHAVEYLSRVIREQKPYGVLLGVTGSGKTYTMAKVIEQVQKPTLVIVHNKTLAAQLYREFKTFMPNNAVQYFVSYYDYYQPEAYIPQSDTYIEKDSQINDEIDRMRHRATNALFERRDVLIVASVSCIFSLGSPDSYYGMLFMLETGQSDCDRDELIKRLIELQYDRNDYELRHGTFRVRGDVIELFPLYADFPVRIAFEWDVIESLTFFHPLTGESTETTNRLAVMPNSHYVTPADNMARAVRSIRAELNERLQFFESENKYLEAQRLLQRTTYDLEMLKELGYCHGIENYSAHFTDRKPGDRPPTLLNYFPDDWLVFIDESHVTVPQIRGMYEGDRSRKDNLVRYGFRLPSAFDNRPLRFEEFEALVPQVIFVSATPGPYERARAGETFVEQITRPTGLIDPEIIVRPAQGQVDDLLNEIKIRAEANQRVLVTTLTKRMAEDLTEYYQELGLRVRYLHSDIDTIKRVELIRDLRKGEFDTLIGINLLREGLDIPEVTLVAILDADKEGFLRSATSLVQTIGRTARNIHGQVIMYADAVTQSMKQAIDETNRRRAVQQEYNRTHNITPESITKSISDILESVYEADYYTVPLYQDKQDLDVLMDDAIGSVIDRLERDMKEHAARLEFEKAAEIRDKIKKIKQDHLFLGGDDLDHRSGSNE